jgi:hypothetical protein
MWRPLEPVGLEPVSASLAPLGAKLQARSQRWTNDSRLVLGRVELRDSGIGRFLVLLRFYSIARRTGYCELDIPPSPKQ